MEMSEAKVLKILFFMVCLNRDLGHGDRQGKWLNVFTLVRFPNAECPTNLLDYVGTCYTAKECRKFGGKISGRCAQNLGVCCLFLITCGQSSSQNNTYFRSPDFPESSPSLDECEVTIRPLVSGICQYRMDFITFDISQPRYGRCEGNLDSFTFTVGKAAHTNYGLPPSGLCGRLTGQHVYLDGGDQILKIRIVGGTDLEVDSPRKWLIKIMQIGCDSEYKAPTGCLQYHSETEGQIASLNFNPSEGFTYFDFLRYTVCLKATPDYCSVLWTAISFRMRAKPAISGESGVGDSQCSADYVIIPSGTDKEETLLVPFDRYCGQFLNPRGGLERGLPVLSGHRPFQLWIRTDDSGVDTGFNMTFTLMRC